MPLKYFIVHAHHEPASFNGAMTRRAVADLTAAGHEVKVSDLYTMGFDPVSDRRNFTTVANPAFLKQQNEERHATEHNGFAPDIAAEMDKLAWCDVLVFQFPLWWFSMPAILKGWLERVLIPHETFTMPEGNQPIRGLMQNIRVLAVVTSLGSPKWWWWLVGHCCCCCCW